MKRENKDARMAEIEAAAYALLAKFGYENISMLKIAKAAKASNETLYNWYGDKKGLFAAMIRRNASATLSALDDSMLDQDVPEVVLKRASSTLLTMLMSANAIALNKAAAGDATGELGQVLNEEGRRKVAPKFLPLIEHLNTARPAAETLEIYLSVLIGDWQIKRVIGVMAEPESTEIDARIERAIRMVQNLS